MTDKPANKQGNDANDKNKQEIQVSKVGQNESQLNNNENNILNYYNFENAQNYIYITDSYDPDGFPPDFNSVEQHKLAMRVAPPLKVQDQQKQILCKCCLREVERGILPVNCLHKDLLFLGPGYSLFLEFYKNSIFILIIFFFISGIYNFLTNLWYGQDCNDNIAYSSNLCYSTWFTKSSLGNKISKKDLFQMQEYLNLFSIGMIILFLQFFRKDQRELTQSYDSQELKVNNYSVFIRNIPIAFTAERNDYNLDFKQFIEKVVYSSSIGNDNYNSASSNQKSNYQRQNSPRREIQKIDVPNQDLLNVAEINFCYNLSERIKLINEKNQSLNQIFKKYSGNYRPELISQEIKNTIEKCNAQISQVYRYCGYNYNMDTMKQHFAGYAFVSFQTQSEKDTFLKFCEIPFTKGLFNKKTKLLYQQNYLIAEQALDPSLILWENMSYNQKELKKSRLISNGIIIGIVLLSGIIQFGINKFLSSIYDNKSNRQTAVSLNLKSGSYFLVIVIGVVLALIMIAFNYALIFMTEKIIEKEKYVNVEERHIAQSQKLTFAHFVNSSIFLLLLGVSLNGKSEGSKNILGQVGLAQNQTIFLICYSVVPIIMNLVNVPFMFKRKQINKISKDKDKILMTQDQLKKVYENPEFQIASFYGQLLGIMFTTVFFGPLIPMAFIYSIISLAAQYYTIKVILIKKSNVTYKLGIGLSNKMVSLIELTLPIYSIGNLLFAYYLRDTNDISLLGWFSLGIGLAHAFLPHEFITTMLFPLKKGSSRQETYDNAILYMKQTYSSINPVTRSKYKEQIAKLAKQKPNFALAFENFKNFMLSNKAGNVSQLQNISQTQPQEQKVNPATPNNQTATGNQNQSQDPTNNQNQNQSLTPKATQGLNQTLNQSVLQNSQLTPNGSKVNGTPQNQLDLSTSKPETKEQNQVQSLQQQLLTINQQNELKKIKKLQLLDQKIEDPLAKTYEQKVKHLEFKQEQELSNKQYYERQYKNYNQNQADQILLYTTE